MSQAELIGRILEEMHDVDDRLTAVARLVETPEVDVQDLDHVVAAALLATRPKKRSLQAAALKRSLARKGLSESLRAFHHQTLGSDDASSVRSQAKHEISSDAESEEPAPKKRFLVSATCIAAVKAFLTVGHYALVSDGTHKTPLPEIMASYHEWVALQPPGTIETKDRVVSVPRFTKALAALNIRPARGDRLNVPLRRLVPPVAHAITAPPPQKSSKVLLVKSDDDEEEEEKEEEEEAEGSDRYEEDSFVVDDMPPQKRRPKGRNPFISSEAAEDKDEDE